MEAMNVDNFPIFTKNSKSGNLRYPDRLERNLPFKAVLSKKSCPKSYKYDILPMCAKAHEFMV